MSNLEHILRVSRFAAKAGKLGPLSTSEGLAAALVLNRFEWLDGYTIAEALERIGESWASLIPEAARQLYKEFEIEQEAAGDRARETQTEAFLSSGTDENQVLHANAKLVTYGHAPGYRSASFQFDVTPLGSDRTMRVDLHVYDPADTESMLLHLRDIHRSAWTRSGGKLPIDVKPDEQQPAWVRSL
jgi:hypothetical protein